MNEPRDKTRYVFEIVIRQRLSKRKPWPVIVDRRRPADTPVRVSGTFSYSPVELLMTQTAQDYGAYLGERIFSRPIQRALDRALGESGQSLRVLLTIEDEGLRELRWERLCAPLDSASLDSEQWSFLARNQRTPFAFYLPSAIDRSFPLINRSDLRALLVVASPAGLQKDWGLEEFDPQASVDAALRGLHGIPTDVLANVAGAAGPPSLDALMVKLSERFYPILHIVAHGKLQEGEIAIFLADGIDNRIDRVIGARLLMRLGTLKNSGSMPHFVFLSTCSSASPGTADAVGSVAQRLVRDLGIPAVLAMTDLVKIETATILSEQFYRFLSRHGEVDSALAEACAGLGDHADVTVPALFSRLGERALFRAETGHVLEPEELRAGLRRFIQLIDERAPTLRPDAATLLSGAGLQHLVEIVDGIKQVLKPDAEELLADAGVSLAPLSEQTLLGIDNLLRDIVPGISFTDLAQDTQLPPYIATCPFPGLLPFREQHEEPFFFGREDKVQLLDQRIRRMKSGIIPILGNSGTGKSSLVYAGLGPKLRRRRVGLISMTPGNDPPAQLAAALTTLAQAQGTAVLFIDQFEELFTLNNDAAGLERRARFVERLTSVAQQWIVLLTMRADFCGDCAGYDLLNHMLRSQLLLAPIDAEDLHDVMLQQADAADLVFEAGLSGRILDDVRGEPGAMPLLQHALRELWKRRRGPYLRTIEYDAMGGVRGAIARTADQFYQEKLKNDSQRAIMKHLFLRLTRTDIDALPGVERRDTRRRVPRDELVPADGDQDATNKLIEDLASARLLVTRQNELTNKREVEVAHEALIRHWDRLQAWLEQDRQIARFREQITRESSEWLRSQKHDDYLLQGRRLSDRQEELKQQKLTFDELALNSIEHEFVDESITLPARKAAEVTQTRAALDLETVYATDRNQGQPAQLGAKSTLERTIDIEIRFSNPGRHQVLVELMLVRAQTRSQLAYNVPILLDQQQLQALSLDMQAYSQVLTAMMFDPPALRESWRRVRAFTADDRLRVRLQFAEDSTDLSALNWELLADPMTGSLLAQSERTSIIRDILSTDLRMYEPAARNRIRLVAAVSSPNNLAQYGLPQIDTAAVLQNIYSSVTSLPIDTLGEDAPVTTQNLLHTMRSNPTILYLNCPMMIRDGEAYVFLEDDKRLVSVIDGRSLAQQISNLQQRPLLIILAGAQSSAYQFAQGLIRSGVPAVMTIDGDLLIAEHNLLIANFFRELQRDGRPDRALAAARSGLDPNSSAWAGATLFMRSGVNQIWSDG